MNATTQRRGPVEQWLQPLEQGPSKRVFGGMISLLFQPGKMRGVTRPDGKPVSYGFIVNNFLALMVPLALTVGTYAGTWWYVVIHSAPAAISAPVSMPQPAAAPAQSDKPQELGRMERTP